jgi:hypothetical protein
VPASYLTPRSAPRRRYLTAVHQRERLCVDRYSRRRLPRHVALCREKLLIDLQEVVLIVTHASTRARRSVKQHLSASDDRVKRRAAIQRLDRVICRVERLVPNAHGDDTVRGPGNLGLVCWWWLGLWRRRWRQHGFARSLKPRVLAHRLVVVNFGVVFWVSIVEQDGMRDTTSLRALPVALGWVVRR